MCGHQDLHWVIQLLVRGFPANAEAGQHLKKVLTAKGNICL